VASSTPSSAAIGLLVPAQNAALSAGRNGSAFIAALPRDLGNGSSSSLATGSGTNLANGSGPSLANGSGTNLANGSGITLANGSGTNLANGSISSLANGSGTNLANGLDNGGLRRRAWASQLKTWTTEVFRRERVTLTLPEQRRFSIASLATNAYLL
jgi:hypothetical protein